MNAKNVYGLRPRAGQSEAAAPPDRPVSPAFRAGDRGQVCDEREAIERTHPVRVIVDADNDAHEIALDEDIAREAMHLADQFEAFRRFAEEKG